MCLYRQVFASLRQGEKELRKNGRQKTAGKGVQEKIWKRELCCSTGNGWFA